MPRRSLLGELNWQSLLGFSYYVFRNLIWIHLFSSWYSFITNETERGQFESHLYQNKTVTLSSKLGYSYVYFRFEGTKRSRVTQNHIPIGVIMIFWIVLLISHVVNLKETTKIKHTKMFSSKEYKPHESKTFFLSHSLSTSDSFS